MQIADLSGKISKVFSAAVVLAGLAVMAGWIFDVGVLKSIFPQWGTMKANAALCFVLTGLALFFLNEEQPGRLIVRILALPVLLTGLLTLCEYLFRWDLRIDQLLFKESIPAVLTHFSGRMAMNTALSFFLTGVVLSLNGVRREFLSYLKQALMFLVGVVALFALVGYLYGAELLYIGPHFSSAMAFHTAVCFALVSAAYLFSRPGEGFMRDISSEHYGGLILRRALPITIVTPLLIGWVRIQLVSMNLMEDKFGIAFVALANLFMITFSVYILSVFLNQIDADRTMANAAVKKNESLLQEHVRKLNDALREAEKSREIMVSMLDDNNETRSQLEKKLQELRETQYMLFHTEKLASLGELVSSIAHEVNNPLMIISGNAQLCRMEKIQDKVLEENIQNIIDQCERAKEIIERMLTFSKPAKGEFAAVDIFDPLDFSVRLLEHQYSLMNIAISKNYVSGLPKVWIDEKQIHEVFVNLLKNAAEAMPQGGKISIHAVREPERIKITITDTGCGISEKAMKNLFVPFYTTKEKGTGLGLPVCYGIIKAHGGEISYQSHPGQGTTVTVLLPIKR